MRGWVATETDPLGNTTTYSYSATGKLTKQTQWMEQGNPGDDFANLSYDDIDRLAVVTDARGKKTTYTYDSVSNVTGVTLANGFQTTMTYDERNRRVTSSAQFTTTYVYDHAGNLTAVVDPLSHATTYQYDALNRATTITDAEGGIITLVYDEASRQTVVVDPVSNRTTFSYDAADRVTTMVDALGTVVYGYNAGDELTSKTDRLNRQVTFAYDSGGRMTNERWLDSSGGTVRTITYTYDDENRLLSVTDPDAALSFGYDSGGNLISARTSGGGSGQPDVTLSYTYTPWNARESMTDDLGSVGRTTYMYDEAQRLTTITRSFGGSAGPQVLMNYDDADWLTGIDRSISGGTDRVRTTIAYDSAGRVGTIQHTHEVLVFISPNWVVDSSTPLATYVYGYDNAGRLTTENNAEGLATYSYDDTNQLIGVDRPDGQTDESYGYDLNGNRNTTGYTTISGNRMTESPGYTYTYDAEGNTSAKTETSTGKVTTYAYDHRNRLTGVTQKESGGSVIMQASYTYDALGRRIKTDVDPDGAGSGGADVGWYLYDGWNTYADFNFGGTLLVRYLYGPALDELLARTTSGGTTAWYLTDRLGSVRDIADTSGSIIYHAAYEAFGAIISESGSGGDRFKFTARELEVGRPESHYRARSFVHATGRFTTPDPIGFAANDANLYRYVGNSPLGFRDPLGFSQDRPLGVGGGGNMPVMPREQWVHHFPKHPKGQWTPPQFFGHDSPLIYHTGWGCGGLAAWRAGAPLNKNVQKYDPMDIPRIPGVKSFSTFKEVRAVLAENPKAIVIAIQNPGEEWKKAPGAGNFATYFGNYWEYSNHGDGTPGRVIIHTPVDLDAPNLGLPPGPGPIREFLVVVPAGVGT